MGATKHDLRWGVEGLHIVPLSQSSSVHGRCSLASHWGESTRAKLRGICQSVGVSQTKLPNWFEIRSSFRGGPGHEGSKEGSLFDSIIARNPQVSVEEVDKAPPRPWRESWKSGRERTGQAQDLVVQSQCRDTILPTGTVHRRKTQCLS